MKYYISIKNGKLDTDWCREDNDENQRPDYVKQEEVLEITEEQYKNLRDYKIENGKLVIDQEKAKLKRKYEIYRRLQVIDLESVRPLRAVASNSLDIDFDIQKLNTLENEAKTLRLELKDIEDEQ